MIMKRAGFLKGVIEAPPSKSYSHRAVLAASLATGTSRIGNVSGCDDVRRTIYACRKLGAAIKGTKIKGFGGATKSPKKVYFGGSGTSLRLMLPLFSFRERPARIDGDKSLRRRPNGELIGPLERLGAKIKSRDGRLPMTVFPSALKGGKISLDAKSSQFLSALLFACPLAERETEIRVKNLVSWPYVRMTQEVLQKAGIRIEWRGNTFKIKPGQEYGPFDFRVPGDWSLSSFFIAACSLMESDVVIKGLWKDSQGDRRTVRILNDMGAGIKTDKDAVKINGPFSLNGIRVDCSDYPDLVPPIAAAASFAEGRTEIRDIEHLRAKESDRINGIVTILKKSGVKAKGGGDYIIIEGKGPDFVPKKAYIGEREHLNDHRLVMMASILGLKGGAEIKNPGCVKKSYPAFWRDLACLT